MIGSHARIAVFGVLFVHNGDRMQRNTPMQPKPRLVEFFAIIEAEPRGRRGDLNAIFSNGYL